MFVAFGASFDAFAAQMPRTAGMENGVTDALFKFTQPLTGAYFWCPPVKRGKGDCSRLLRGCRAPYAGAGCATCTSK